jgi:hypothetical protein
MRLEFVVQWLGRRFVPGAFEDGISTYEVVSDLRDYGSNGWRSLRRSIGSSGRTLLDIVADTIGARRIAQGSPTPDTWVPLSPAYIDERREVFAFAPERVLLLAVADSTARALTDTVIRGAAHARVAATVGGFATTLLLRRGDGMLAAAIYRAEQPLDMGLAGYGPMRVEIWYSRWQPLANGVVYPMALDVRRAGAGYKRILATLAQPNVPAPADSFAISDSLRQQYIAQGGRAMHDLPLDSARMVGQRLAQFGTAGYPTGAVKVGDSWLLLGSGIAPFNAERATTWLTSHDAGSKIGGVIIPVAGAISGGTAWFAERQLPIRLGHAARGLLDVVLENRGKSTASLIEVRRPQWIRMSGDSLWVEPMDLPERPDALALYLSDERWAYAPWPGAIAKLRAHGFVVERAASGSAIDGPAPR